MISEYKKISLMVVLSAAMMLAACSDRDRTNPLDPGNPDRDRSNIGFNALAGNRQVLLEWDRLDFIDLAGVRVQRVEAGSADTVTVTDTTLALTSQRYIDNTALNGVTYTYNLAFDVTGSSERPTTLGDSVTPGPVFSWVDLIDYGEVVLFTPDFRDEVVSLDASFFGVVDIQVDRAIWVLDFDGLLHRFERNGEYIGSELQNVSSFEVEPVNSSIWVASAGSSGLIYHFHVNGELLSSKATNVPVTSLSIDSRSRDIWVGSTEPKVIKLNSATTNNTITEYENPDFISPELVVSTPGLAGAWIGDRGSDMVFYMNIAQVNWSKEGFIEVSDIAVDNDGNYCFVADAIADQVWVLDARNGQQIAKLSGFGNPYYVVFNNETHTALVSGSTGLISNVSVDGDIVWQIQNPDRTGKIALAY